MDGPSNSALPPPPTEHARVTRLPNANPRYVDVPPAPSPAPTITASDVYYTLFRHKWKILICAVAGLCATVVVNSIHPPPYVSEAKLFVRYVVTGGRTLGPAGEGAQTKSPDQGGETIMTSEAEVLTSLDLAMQAANVIGPEKILAKVNGGKDATVAAAYIKRNLTVEVTPHSSVIHISFRHPDPEIVQPVLREVIIQYLKMHVEIHRAVGIVGDFLTQETDQLRSRLAQTEEELRKARNKAGVISVEDAKKSYTEQTTKIRQEIFDAQAELAERSSVLHELSKGSPDASAAAPGADANAEPPLSPAQIDEYRSALARLDLLRRREQELLTQFTEENSRVKEVRAQLADAESSRKKLEQANPRLARTAVAVPTANASAATPTVNLAAQAAYINALQSKIKVLTGQLEEIRTEAANVDQMEGALSELRRRKELEEANYKYYSASLEQSRIDEALGAGRVSNISQIQSPSAPYREQAKILKLNIGIAAGAIAVGLAWAFFTELYVDRTIRRPHDFERAVNIPLFLSIPKLSSNRRRWPLGGSGANRPALPAPDEVGRVIPIAPSADTEVGRVIPNAPSADTQVGRVIPNAPSPSDKANPDPKPKVSVELIPWDAAKALDPYYSTLRDRLIGYFENQGLTHKPKLVALTGLSREAGVSTIASGLAKCFSETGEGNVLLVDMTQGQGAAQQFFKGEAVHGLDEVLETKAGSQVQENLFVVTEASNSEKLTRALPKRFTQLVPKLKASDFDYIIFDMPPVSQISITPRLAGFMDMVLMVVESEKTDREILQRATDLLAQSKSHVGAVLNKTRNYGPSRRQEFDGLQ